MMPRFGRMAVVLLVAAAAAGCADGPAQPPTAGAKAPDYTARSLAGDPVSLEALRGGPVLLNVWATWCHPCREEMPAIEALHRELGGRGLQVVAVSIDRRGAGGEVRRFVNDMELTFSILHDPDQEVTRAFRTRGVPETFLIGADGTVLHRWIGQIDPAEPETRAKILAAVG
jgi:cytochrome c biogenesis protein CcmG, thiol:disulfide interchange protein DsbE